jgi:GxxExxY protein
MVGDKQELDARCEQIIAACIEVHKQLGPGLLESVYHAALVIEFDERKIPFVSEYPVVAQFKGHELGVGLRVDFVIYDSVVLEIKAVQELTADHIATTISYVTLAHKSAALLVNFNKTLLVDGVRRLYPRVAP